MLLIKQKNHINNDVCTMMRLVRLIYIEFYKNIEIIYSVKFIRAISKLIIVNG